MKIQLVGMMAAMLAVGVVGCGDDESGGGGGTGTGAGNTGATGTGGDTGTGGTGAGNTGATGTGGSTGGGGGAADCASMGDDCRTCCADANPDGTLELQSLVFNSCCDAGGACETECAADPGCGTAGEVAVTDSACETCINELASTTACVIGSLGDCNASPCSDALSCLLSCP